MMNEKQIYRRMNEAYESEYGDRVDDEWYGDDDYKVWRFYRPSEHLEVKMIMVEECKRIDIFEKRNGEYQKVGNYSWRR